MSQNIKFFITTAVRTSNPRQESYVKFDTFVSSDCFYCCTWCNYGEMDRKIVLLHYFTDGATLRYKFDRSDKGNMYSSVCLTVNSRKPGWWFCSSVQPVVVKHDIHCTSPLLKATLILVISRPALVEPICSSHHSCHTLFLITLWVMRWRGHVACTEGIINAHRILLAKSEGEHYYKKFWEELIDYFPLIRRGPHRKRNGIGSDSKVIS
jgi:hypothetical protein